MATKKPAGLHISCRDLLKNAHMTTVPHGNGLAIHKEGAGYLFWITKGIDFEDLHTLITVYEGRYWEGLVQGREDAFATLRKLIGAAKGPT
jgi:hypothetical protein